MKTTHLVKRAVNSLLQTPPNPQDIAVVSQVLNIAELAVWSDMQYRDQRHSVVVLRRFDILAPAGVRADRASALLHDVGKNISNLGFVSRVIATVVAGVAIAVTVMYLTVSPDLIAPEGETVVEPSVK